MRQVKQHNRSPGRTLEIGSRNINGSVRYMFQTLDYTGIDIVQGPGVDVVADGADWDGDGGLYDTIICCEVLEHARNTKEVCENIYRLLRRGGRAIITAASTERVPHSWDGGPIKDGEHYQPITAYDLERWFAGHHGLFIDESSPGDIYAVMTA